MGTLSIQYSRVFASILYQVGVFLSVACAQYIYTCTLPVALLLAYAKYSKSRETEHAVLDDITHSSSAGTALPVMRCKSWRKLRLTFSNPRHCHCHGSGRFVPLSGAGVGAGSTADLARETRDGRIRTGMSLGPAGAVFNKNCASGFSCAQRTGETLMSSRALPLSALDRYPARPLGSIGCRRPPTNATSAVTGVAASPLPFAVLAVLTCLTSLFSFVHLSTATALQWPLRTCPDGCCTVYIASIQNLSIMHDEFA
jgi:hypothetical protein